LKQQCDELPPFVLSWRYVQWWSPVRTPQIHVYCRMLQQGLCTYSKQRRNQLKHTQIRILLVLLLCKSHSMEMIVPSQLPCLDYAVLRCGGGVRLFCRSRPRSIGSTIGFASRLQYQKMLYYTISFVPSWSTFERCHSLMHNLLRSYN
jgi:hypothetical protein